MFRNRTYKAPRSRGGQSTVEYILVVTAVIAVIIVITKGVFTQSVNSALAGATNQINAQGNVLNGSHNGTIDTSIGATGVSIPADQGVDTNKEYTGNITGSLL